MTLTNKTITNGKYNGIYDTNGALVVGVGATADTIVNERHLIDDVIALCQRISHAGNPFGEVLHLLPHRDAVDRQLQSLVLLETSSLVEFSLGLQ